MSKNKTNSNNFDSIKYQPYNENEDDSMYQSAIDYREDQENISFSIKDKDKISKKTDITKRSKNNLLNATIYNKKNPENRSNKYVDDETMSSYLSISDLQEDAKDNVNVLRSNISKLYLRDEKINQLDNLSDNLIESANRFKKSSSILKNKMFWIHLVNILLIIFFIVLIVYLILKLKS